MSSLNGASGAWGRGFGVNLPSSCRMSDPLVAKQGASSDSCLEPTKPSCHGSPPFVWPAVGHAFQSVQVAGPTGAMSAGATWSFAPTAKTVPVQAVYKGGGTTCCRPLSYEGLGTARSMRSFGHVGATDGPCCPGMGVGVRKRSPPPLVERRPCPPVFRSQVGSGCGILSFVTRIPISMDLRSICFKPWP